MGGSGFAWGRFVGLMDQVIERLGGGRQGGVWSAAILEADFGPAQGVR